MKVVQVAASQANAWGGPVTAVRALSAQLQELGVEVAITSAAGGRTGTPEMAPKGVDSVAVELGYFGRWWTGYSRRFGRVFDRSQAEADLVHIHEPWHYPGVRAFWSAKRHGKPVVFSVHDALSPWKLKHKKLRKRICLTLFQRSILQNADAVHALTETEEAQIRRVAPGAKIAVIPNGVVLEEFSQHGCRRSARQRMCLGKDDIAILFLGRIHRVKGIDVLLRAVRLMRVRIPNVRVLVVGPDSGFENDARDLSRKLGLDDVVLWRGPVRRSARLDAFRAADVFALPSHSEGFSLSVLEAMAMRLPVVISPACSLAEVAEVGAGIVEDAEPGSLARALEQVCGDSELRERMGERGRMLVERKYTQRAVAEEFLELYAEFVRG